MSLTPGALFAGLVFGSIGLFLILYGKKLGHFWFIVLGIALEILPMAVGDTTLLWLAGAALTGLAWYLR